MNLVERIRTFAGKAPTLAPDAYVAPGAVLVGDVHLGAQASVWFQAAVRADLNVIRVGARSNIQDGAVIHVADAHGTHIGEDVTVGHGAVLHACTVGDAVLVGMNAVVLDGASIGARSIIGANALVTAGTRVPEGSLFLGSPGKVVRPLSQQEQAGLASWADRYVTLSQHYREGVAQVLAPCLPATPSSETADSSQFPFPTTIPVMTNSPLPPGLQHTLQTAPLPEALQAVLDHFGCQAGTYHQMQEGALQLVASLHIPPPVVSLIQRVPLGKGLAGLAAERREPVSLCNLQTDTSGQAQPAAKTTGMEGSVAVPALGPDGALHGVLGIARAAAYDWSDAEKAAVCAAAALLGVR